MSLTVEVSIADDAWDDGNDWAMLADRAIRAALSDGSEGEVSVLLTSDEQVQALNRDHRGKDKPTNVLSFEGDDVLLGDIVLARGVIVREAAAQSKTLTDHVTHLLVHGTLHLVGLDHEDDDEAESMEAREIAILSTLGVANPYEPAD